MQDQLAPVADSVQQTLGPVYAGIWFDNSAGGIMKVEVTNLKSPQVLASEQAVAEQGFASDVDFQAVASSWSQLAAGQASLDQQFQDLEAAKKLSTQLDASTNSVDVEASTSLSPQQLAAVQAAAGASPVSAVVTQVPASTLQFTDAANSCAQTPGLAGIPSATGKGPFLFCDSPLRGGPAIVAPALHDPNSAQLCTMGFFAHKGSSRFVLTSGHCLKAAGPTWSTEFPDQDFMGHAAYTPIKLGNNYSFDVRRGRRLRRHHPLEHVLFGRQQRVRRCLQRERRDEDDPQRNLRDRRAVDQPEGPNGLRHRGAPSRSSGVQLHDVRPSDGHRQEHRAGKGRDGHQHVWRRSGRQRRSGLQEPPCLRSDRVNRPRTVPGGLSGHRASAQRDEDAAGRGGLTDMRRPTLKQGIWLALVLSACAVVAVTVAAAHDRARRAAHTPAYAAPWRIPGLGRVKLVNDPTDGSGRRLVKKVLAPRAIQGVSRDGRTVSVVYDAGGCFLDDGKVEAHETAHSVEIVVVESRYGRFLKPGRPPFCSAIFIIGQATIRLASPVDGRSITGGPHY